MNKEFYRFKSKYFITILILIILSISILFISSKFFYETSMNKFLDSIASILLITGVYSLFNEYILKKELIELVCNKVDLKEEIEETGLIEIFTDVHEIPYKKYIENANKRIDIVHIYGSSWTSRYKQSIRDKLIKTSCNIKVVLLSPESEFITPIENHIKYKRGDIKSKISHAIDRWDNLYKEIVIENKKFKKDYFKLYLHKKFPAKALYRFDDIIVVVPRSCYNNDNSSALPAYVFKNCNSNKNNLYDIYSSEIKGVIRNSEEHKFVEVSSSAIN